MAVGTGAKYRSLSAVGKSGRSHGAITPTGHGDSYMEEGKEYLEVGDYEVVEICLDGRPLPYDKKNPIISPETLLRLPGDPVHTLRVTLE